MITFLGTGNFNIQFHEKLISIMIKLMSYFLKYKGRLRGKNSYDI